LNSRAGSKSSWWSASRTLPRHEHAAKVELAVNHYPLSSAAALVSSMVSSPICIA
jgi:hypothetical protein